MMNASLFVAAAMVAGVNSMVRWNDLSLGNQTFYTFDHFKQEFSKGHTSAILTCIISYHTSHLRPRNPFLAMSIVDLPPTFPILWPEAAIAAPNLEN